MEKLKIKVNNQRTVEASFNFAGNIDIEHKDSKGITERKYTISQGDFIMLLNYYNNQKENNKEIF